MSKRNKAKKLPSSLLDTSVFYERLKVDLPTFSSKLDKLNPGQRFGVNYSVIELNLGLIQNWVEYYKLVQSYQNVADAIAFATNWYGRRSGAVGILQSLNARFNSVVECQDVDRYLDYLESTIANAVVILESMVSDFIGNFQNHRLAKLVYLTRDDYEEFIVACKQEKIVPIGEYLEEQSEKLKALSKHIDEVLKAHNTDRNRKLKGLVEEAISSPLSANKPSNNQKYGDIIIALDAPKKHILVSKDTAFEILCNGLGKQYLNY